MTTILTHRLTLAQRSALLGVRPKTPNQLRQWLRLVLDIDVPVAALIPGHTPPFDYLCHTFFEEGQSRDCVVWAARGAGKTFYAAVATLLDMLFKPGIDVRVLGGSLEQSRRMHEHLRRLLEPPALRDLVSGRPAAHRLRLCNGSSCEVLAQSHTSVRGARPQKLRCDEVELFDPDVWRAAQLVTRSKRCGDVVAHGCVEALSTWHIPGGLMSEIVGSASASQHDTTGKLARRLFRWGVVDVLETCPRERVCDSCSLWPECEGRAREASGHFRIDDAVAMKTRSDSATWDAEMLCKRPSRSDAVFPEFDPAIHVIDADPVTMSSGAHADGRSAFVMGVDFGFRAPTVLLWAHVEDASSGGVVRVLDERVQSGVTLEQHIDAIRTSKWAAPTWVGIDPAGEQRHEQTGSSNALMLRRAGLTVRARRLSLEEGLRVVRARLAPASGPPRLFVHRRCERLIDALLRYRYPSDRPDATTPMKDGADHPVDALRYMLVNLDRPFRTSVEGYW